MAQWRQHRTCNAELYRQRGFESLHWLNFEIMYLKDKVTKEDVQKAISETTTMGGAAKLLNLDYRTFRPIALNYGLFKPTKGNIVGAPYKMEDILNGKYPQYPTHKLSKRLITEGYKKDECEKCHLTKWNGLKITLELNHIDGNNANHKFENLELLCPNCHSQTPTFKGKNVKIRNIQRKNGE